MKTIHNTAEHVKRILGVTAICCLLAVPVLNAANVEINWDEPDRFSDVSDDWTFVQSDFEIFKESFTKYVQKLADRYMPPDADLTLTIRDVDLAGELEPWRKAPNNNIRIVREIYPPRIKFHYNISYAGDGRMVDESGMAQITDLTFLWSIERSIRGYDRFFYTKELIEDWFRRHVEDLFDNGS